MTSAAHDPAQDRRPYRPRSQRGRHSRPEQDSPLPWLLVGFGSLLAVALIVGIALPGWLHYTVLEERAVQQGVARVLTNSGYTVGHVSCPEDQPVEVGHRFSCRATVDGEHREVPIAVRTPGGEYEVGEPR